MVQASVLDVDSPQGGDVYGLGHGLTHKDHTPIGKRRELTPVEADRWTG